MVGYACLKEKMERNVFTYGSLMFDRVWSLVVNGAYRNTGAKLYRYRRKKVCHETYPALIPGVEQDMVEGVVYLGVSAEDVGKLDVFEGKYYSRDTVQCELPDGKMITACVYVFKKRYRDLLTDEDWDPDWFARVGIHTFLDDYEGF